MNCNYDLKDYENGDKMKVKSKISFYSGGDIYLSDYTISKGDKITCKTIISKK
ncbi:MAG: hypothetical protein IKF19_01765 [Bacilli bacterium]|nr:hypothetical protein [Bacilli bacterium]